MQILYNICKHYKVCIICSPDGQVSQSMMRSCGGKLQNPHMQTLGGQVSRCMMSRFERELHFGMQDIVAGQVS